MSESKNRRTNIEMIAEILMLCRKPTAKTQIMYKTNMSYAAIQKFLKQLQKFGLLSFDDGAEKYNATEKGLEFVRRYLAIQDLLKS